MTTDKMIWSPIWGWYKESEWDKKRLETVAKAEQGLEELEQLDGKLEKVGSLIEEARLLEKISRERN